ncbi:bidirectional sugar transporter N3-like protein [Tanacetum coccineum]
MQGNLVSTGVYFAPMPTFIKICKRKSTMGFESLPYVVSLFSALLWMYYSFIKEGNTFLLITVNALGSLIETVYVIIFIIYATPYGRVPNVLGFVLGMIQMSLYQYYKQKGKTKKNTAEKKLPEHIVNIKILNSEVVPVGSSRSSGSEVEEEIKTANGGEEWGEREVVEKNKGGVKVVIDDEPCGIEVVNVKPIVLVMCA